MILYPLSALDQTLLSKKSLRTDNNEKEMRRIWLTHFRSRSSLGSYRISDAKCSRRISRWDYVGVVSLSRLWGLPHSSSLHFAHSLADQRRERECVRWRDRDRWSDYRSNVGRYEGERVRETIGSVREVSIYYVDCEWRLRGPVLGRDAGSSHGENFIWRIPEVTLLAITSDSTCPTWLLFSVHCHI